MPEEACAAEHARQRDVADHDAHKQRAHRVHHRRRQMLAEERDRSRFEEQDRAAKHHAAKGEGQAAERHRLGDLKRRQPPMRIQPIAHRRAGHRREAEIVRQRIGAERSECDATVRHLVSGVDRAEPIVDGQHAIGEHGEQEADRQCAQWYVMQRGDDVVQPQMAEFLLHDVDRADQQQNAEDRRQLQQAGPADLACALCRHRRQPASAGRDSAASISATVSSMPYNAMKPPKRGPSCWPSST